MVKYGDEKIDQVERRTLTYVSKLNGRSCLKSPQFPDLTDLTHHHGKVRDVFITKKELFLIATDRQSAFDRNLTSIPLKSHILTQISLFWFNQTQHIITNHVLNPKEQIHPAVLRCRKCDVFPIEFVVRGYLTGSTSTSMWTHYNQNPSALYCGHKLPENMLKHQKLPCNLVTPTTKDSTHDELISGEEIVKQQLMTQKQWDFCQEKALELFQFGQELAKQRGLILVDTKYEFGLDPVTQEIVLIDEIHTPDSSRFWIAATYDQKMEQKQAPDMIDKEFLRLWFRERCDPYTAEVLPTPPSELIVEVARRYIMLYEIITGEIFQFPSLEDECSADDQLAKDLQTYFTSKES